MYEGDSMFMLIGRIGTATVSLALISFTLLLTQGCSDNSPIQNPVTDMQIIRDQIDEKIRSNDTPALQYVVCDSAGIRFEYAAGEMDIAGHRSISPVTTMMLYSMTKTFTAAGVMQLVQNGSVSLEDPVRKHLPNIPYPESLTVRHLLSQTSGIPNPIPLRWAHLVEEHDGFDEQATLDSILKEHPALDFVPGTKYRYSNISSWLLGHVIAKASGMSYEQYMTENIFVPLGLEQRELAFTISEPGNHATGYLRKWSFMNLIKSFLLDSKLIGEYEGSWLSFNPHLLNGPAFGGLVGSARSASVFLQDMLRENPVIMSKNTKTAFFEQQRNNDGELVEMTLGWHVGSVDGIEYFFKEGGGGGFHCEMRVYPSQGIATVVVANNTTFDAPGFLSEIDVSFFAEK
jgi:D-alanyl-D-alanine carboxypeptidase